MRAMISCARSSLGSRPVMSEIQNMSATSLPGEVVMWACGRGMWGVVGEFEEFEEFENLCTKCEKLSFRRIFFVFFTAGPLQSKLPCDMMYNFHFCQIRKTTEKIQFVANNARFQKCSIKKTSKFTAPYALSARPPIDCPPSHAACPAGPSS